MAQATEKQQELIGEIVKKLDAAMSSHSSFVTRLERGYRSYNGILRAQSKAASWRHTLHPPYGFNLIETIVANTVEQGLRMKCSPSPSLTGASMQDIAMLANQSEVVENLIRHEHRVDQMDQKQRPLLLEQAIGGRAFGKEYWNLTEGVVKRQGIKDVEYRDSQDNVLGTLPTITEITESKVLRDHSTFEVIDSRDLIIHESARSLQPWEPGGAQHLFHRGWYSIEQLRTLETSGYLSNVEELTDTRDFSDQYSDRERALYDIQRDKDLIEVIEYWCYKNGTVYRTIVGQRRVMLRDEEESPFWHGGYPFVVCRSQPANFSLHGKSEIELIEQLQEILWELTNQRLDNVELVNNAIMLIDPDAAEDPEAFRWYPGALWPARKDEISPLQVPYQVAEVSLQAEAMLKGDLQNVTSAAPFAGGAETATVDQKTATGASIVMGAAQNRLAAKKYQAQFAFTEEAWMRLKNCQQFIDKTRTLHVLGPDGEPRWEEINVLQIQGEFGFELTPYGESQLRQERRAEATQKTQVLLQALPMGAATQEPLSFRTIMSKFLKEWGEDNPDEYFSQKAAALGAVAAPGGAPGGTPSGGPPGAPVQGDTNMGTTAASAVDASSPSASGGMSMSPQLMAQRALAMSRGGGPRNA